MIIVTVARKPLAGSVAANVNKYGTGGINIDGCRVATGHSPSVEMRQHAAPKESVGLTGCVPLARPPAYNKQSVGEQLGRWPANLILFHEPECQFLGTKTVSSDSPTQARVGLGREGNWTLGIYGAKASKITTGYASPDGTETIQAWDCVPGCPVAALDEQSTGSTTGVRSPTSQEREVPGTAWFVGNHQSREYPNDTGGASRFFKQVSPGDKGEEGPMPRYEYRCTECGYEFERQMHVGDPNPPCPKEVQVRDSEGAPRHVLGGEGWVKKLCGGPTEKLISRSSFVLVGGGWAADGYSK